MVALGRSEAGGWGPTRVEEHPYRHHHHAGSFRPRGPSLAEGHAEEREGPANADADAALGVLGTTNGDSGGNPLLASLVVTSLRSESGFPAALPTSARTATLLPPCVTHSAHPSCRLTSLVCRVCRVVQ
jgi:hypothetical protein